VSEYLGHVSQHEAIESQAKRTYTTERCQELRELVDTELAATPAKKERLSARENGKRTRDIAAIGTDTPRVQRARLDANLLHPIQQLIPHAESFHDPAMSLGISINGDSEPFHEPPGFAPIFGIINYPKGWQ